MRQQAVGPEGVTRYAGGAAPKLKGKAKMAFALDEVLRQGRRTADEQRARYEATKRAAFEDDDDEGEELGSSDDDDDDEDDD